MICPGSLSVSHLSKFKDRSSRKTVNNRTFKICSWTVLWTLSQAQLIKYIKYWLIIGTLQVFSVYVHVVDGGQWNRVGGAMKMVAFIFFT